jgi:1-acyl-sn-glycerol-3-phosphate acyltransferase
MMQLRPSPRRDLPLLLGKVLPVLRALIRMRYLSLDIEGAEHVPRRGAAVYVANHGGWFTLDTMMAALAVADHVGVERLPYGAVQDEVFNIPWVGGLFERAGGFPASWLRDLQRLPPEMDIFSVYPEGTKGNCKPFWQAYRMRAWRTGFVRLAAARGAAIVPVAIVGGEECLPVVTTVRCLQPLVGSILPLPLFPLPLPTKWKIVFHAPVSVDGARLGQACGDLGARSSQARRLADSIRATVQSTLTRETASRPLARISSFLQPDDGAVGGPHRI